jgi:hypothetical protein
MRPVKAARTPLKVYITIDTEVWPHVSRWRESRLAEDIDRDIFGQAAGRSSGLEVQLQMFQAEGLKAIFFVEPFSSVIAGIDFLRRTVGKIHDCGQDVQAHPHTEWLQWTEASPLKGKTGQHLRSFSLADQVTLIRWALSLLADAGAPNVRALQGDAFGSGKFPPPSAGPVLWPAAFTVHDDA